LLAPVDGQRFLQFDVDWRSGRWNFQADARVGAPQWWNAKLRTIDDLRGPVLFKAHHPRQVVFSDLRVQPLESSCALSVIVTCHRFAQRLRVALRAWSQQTLPSGTLEVIVVNPGSPDQTHDVVLAATRAYPSVRVHELSVDGRLFRNKGKLINLGVAAARGEWIWLSDADCLFPPDAATRALARADSRRRLFYCERRHLTEAATAALVTQRNGAAIDYRSLLAHTRSDTNFVPWGYCQLAHRSVFDAVRYREDVESFSNSDITFMESCRANGIELVPLDGVSCLHLVHPWAWQGTRDLL
jgi:Glycosyl transferase family 2